MAMVFCRGCGKEIHESAPTCPYCGAPQKINEKSNSTESIPDGVSGWSWGAFLLNVVWAIGNRTWIGLLALVPGVGFVMAIVLGIKGREWAWKNKQWDSVEHFNRVQRKWSAWGLGLTLFSVAIGIAAAIALPAYQEYVNRSNRATLEIRESKERAVLEKNIQEERERTTALEAQQREDIRTPPENVDQPAPKSATEKSQIENSASVDAQIQDPPIFTVGERVKLESIDDQNQKLSNITQRTVISTENGNTIFKVENIKSGYTRYLTYDKNISLASTRNEKGDIVEFDPPLPYFTFPMTIGQKWTAESNEKINGVTIKRHKINGAIISRENIITKFGKYSAFVIKIDSTLKAEDGTTSFGTDTSWYVPELKRSVRSELRSQNSDGSNLSSKTITMTEYSNE